MKNEKNYIGFLMIKIWQILKRSSRALRWAQTTYFWRVIYIPDRLQASKNTFSHTNMDIALGMINNYFLQLTFDENSWYAVNPEKCTDVIYGVYNLIFPNSMEKFYTYRDFDTKSWFVDFFTYLNLTHENTSQNNFSRLTV